MKIPVLNLLALLLLTLGPALASADSGAGDPVRGAQRWADTCTRCHNVRDPSELETKLWKVSITHMRIRAGLTAKDAEDVLAFMTSGAPDTRQVFHVVPASLPSDLPETSGAPAASRDGAELFQASTCIACHGPDGKGMVPGVPDFTAEGSSLVTKSRAELSNSVLNGIQSPSSPLAMPPKGGDPNLTVADIQALLDFMIETFPRR